MPTIKKTCLRKQGFTLIELLVTISIIVLLSAISLVALQGSRQSGRDARRKSDLESLRSALELYKADCGLYPASISFTPSSSITGSCPTANTYMTQVPLDPQYSSRNYYYRRITNTTYELCAALEGTTTSAGCGGGCGSTCSYRVLNP